MAESRVDARNGERVERPDVDAFLADIIAVCRKHGMVLGHEDGHGAFQVEPFDEDGAATLQRAHVNGA